MTRDHRKPTLSKRILRVFTLYYLRKPRPKIAVVPLKGVVGNLGKWRSRGLVLDEWQETLEKAFSISNLKAVALVINSPGGSPVQAELLSSTIRRLAEEKKVPVYAFAEDVCASGGYWLACAGEEIYAHTSSIVGSIGVIAAGFGLQELIARHGIERRVYHQGENKAMLDPFLPQREEDVHRLLSVQHDVHMAFIEHVKQSRGRRLNADEEELFSGAFWSGKQAKDMGLIDGIGDVTGVIQDKFGKKVKFVRCTPAKSFFSLFSSRLNWTQSLLSGIEERLHWDRFGL